MGYLHIPNLYKAQEILLFKRCYALEKIHGTSAHIKYMHGYPDNSGITYFSGGGKRGVFVELFADMDLPNKLKAMGQDLTIYGEFYGGNLQGMKATYGDKQRFVAFDVRTVRWLSVPEATAICEKLGIEFVAWSEVTTDIESLDAERDKDSTQAIRNGCGTGKKREGVVLRPLIELTDSDDERIIAKHKREDFDERRTPQRVVEGAQLKVLQDAQAIADEWTTAQRLDHVLDKIPGAGLEHMRAVLDAMCEDIMREAEGEILWSKAAVSVIRKKTATMFKRRIMETLNGRTG